MIDCKDTKKKYSFIYRTEKPRNVTEKYNALL